MGVLFLECSEDTCNQRCLARGAAGSGRSDDNVESLRKRLSRFDDPFDCYDFFFRRFHTYQNDTLPIINYYKTQDMVFSVDSNVSADEVFENVEKIIRKIAPDSAK